MGIRYYGHPIAADHYALARENPRFFLCCSGVYDSWRDEHPALAEPALYLDKVFRDLRHLFAPDEGCVPRPALSLVLGEVTNTSRGWIPHHGVLSAAGVTAVAADLASIDFDELALRMVDDERWADEERYVRDYFDRAVEATASWSRAGLGAIYSIG